jgi:protein required for attachment to host cells
MAPPTTFRDDEKRRFARSIAEELNRWIELGEARYLVLMAGPKFLGRLREELSEPAKSAVVFEASKNLSNLETAGVQAYFD